MAAILKDPANKRFVVVSHLRPDGDALGCQLAFGLVLKALGKEVTIWNEDGLLNPLKFLPAAELVSRPPFDAPEEFDVLVALDTATYKRLGTPLQAISKVKTTINIDHHPTNPGYGDLSYIDPVAPATGQILYEFFHSQGFPISPEIASNLFVAISTDTGSFQYPSTTAQTYEIAAQLIRLGAESAKLSQQLYGTFPLRRVYLLRALLHTLELSAEDRVAIFSLDLKMTKELNALPEDNEGLIDVIRSIDTVEIAGFLEELVDDQGPMIRISLRSKHPSVDVSAICQHFGGGGHVLAAGARVRGTLSEVKSRLLEVIHKTLP